MEWIDKLFGKKEEIQKEAELIDAEGMWERKVKANDWIEETMKLDEEVIHQEEASKDAKELEVRAAYVMGDSMEETIEKDYELRVKGLSNYNLAEMLAEYTAAEEGLATLSMNEIKEKQLKSIEGNREAAEKKLLDHIGKHTMVGWKEAFEKFKKEAEHVEPKKEDLYPPFEEKKQSWEKKDHSELQEAPSDKERTKDMEGTGKEEEKGQVAKEAAMTDLTIWKAVEGWNVRARFDSEQEAQEVFDFLKSQEVGSPVGKPPATPEALESKMASIKTEAHRQVSIEEIGSVYSGLPGCACGCRGKYWYAPGEPHADWQGPENPKQVKRIVDLINSAPTLDFDDPEFVSATINGRVYTAYMKGKSETECPAGSSDVEIIPNAPPTLSLKLRNKVEKKACRVGEKVYYRGHPATIKEIFINQYSGEPHVDVEIEGEVLSLSGKEIDQLGDEPLMEEMKHKEDIKVEEPKMEEPKVEMPPMKEEVIEDEIIPLASKAETLKKIAEIESPWFVEKQADGTSIIMRREIKKETKVEDKDLTK